ncbi:MAG: DUF4287 domain-containing protein [Caulobacteraceae bacterium]
MVDSNLTERQQKYFAAVRDSMERATGRSVARWIAIARTCPETGHRARLAWFKVHHGLLQNRASLVLAEAFGSSSVWSDPRALIDALWKDPDARAIYEAVDARAMRLAGALRTARKGYTAWSRAVQFAALKPAKGGTAILGLALPPDERRKLEAPKNAPWSERLRSQIALAKPEDAEAIAVLLAAAWKDA